MTVPRPSTPRLLSLAAILLLFALTLGVPAQASGPPDAPAITATVEADAPQGRHGALWGYLSVLAVGLGMAGAWAWRRHRGARDAHVFAEDIPAALPLIPAPGSRQSGAGGAGTSTPSSGIFAVKGLAEEKLGGIQPPPTPRLEPQRKECPRCKRQFGPALVLCPFDHQALESVSVSAPRRSGRHGDTRLARAMCASCGRRYEHGASFCLHDGKPLVADTVEDAERAPTFRVCPTCGRGDSSDRSTTCPHDGADLLVVAPGQDGEGAQPVLPVAICPSCRHVGAFGQAFCPHDGEVLVPRTHLQEQAFPHRGIGPERSLCEKCGRRYRGEARHCSFDGAALIDLN